MVAHIPVPYVLADTLCCLGLGFLLAAVYDMARFLLGNTKVICFVLDLSSFLLAAVLLCSFSAGRSYSGVVRWYMAVGLLAGMFGYFFVLAPATGALQKILQWAFRLPFLLIGLLLLRPLWRLLKRNCNTVQKKHKAKVAKRRTKQLQKKAQVLYNSN